MQRKVIVSLLRIILALTVAYGVVMGCFMGRLTFPTQSEYVNIARNYIPTVQAIYDYRQDHGAMPDSLQDLVPNYIATVPDLREVFYNNSDPSLSIHVPAPHTGIVYSFDPAREGWSSAGDFGKGPLPLPKLGPTRPAGGGPAGVPATLPAPASAPTIDAATK